MEHKEVEKILSEQLELLTERSKETLDSSELRDLTYAMIALSKELNQSFLFWGR